MFWIIHMWLSFTFGFSDCHRSETMVRKMLLIFFSIILCFHLSSDRTRGNLLTVNFMQIHWSLSCRRLHYSAQFSSTFVAFSLLRLCLKVNLCTIHSVIHGSITVQKACYLQWGNFSFDFLSVTPSPIPYFFNTHVQGVVWNVFVSYMQYLLRNMFSTVRKGMFTSLWASNQNMMYFLWVFVLVKLKWANVHLKICSKNALLWMK